MTLDRLGRITAFDAHWIWQDGQRLTRQPLTIAQGRIKLSDRRGIGIEIDMQQLERANALYKSMTAGSRDDAVTTQLNRYQKSISLYSLKVRS